jgi:hypothetical protein
MLQQNNKIAVAILKPLLRMRVAYTLCYLITQLNEEQLKHYINVINLTSLNLVLITTSMTPVIPQRSKFKAEKSCQVGFNVLKRYYICHNTLTQLLPSAGVLPDICHSGRTICGSHSLMLVDRTTQKFSISRPIRLI